MGCNIWKLSVLYSQFFWKFKTILKLKVGLRVAPPLSWPDRTLSPENWRGAQAPSDSERLGELPAVALSCTKQRKGKHPM